LDLKTNLANYGASPCWEDNFDFGPWIMIPTWAADQMEEKRKTIFARIQPTQMGVSINGDTPQWMVEKMEHPTKVDDLRVPPF
jgi:RNA-splicing ligase RtcB